MPKKAAAATEPQIKTDFEVEQVLVSQLVPDEDNPRNNDKAVEAVAASIREYGFQQCLVIDENNNIVVGHTRYLAAQLLGLKSVPCKRETNLTREKLNEYMVIDNKSNEIATWNYQLLQKNMRNFDLNQDVFKLNFSEAEQITIMQADWSPKPEKLVDEPSGSHEKHLVAMNNDQWRIVNDAITQVREDNPKLTDGEALAQICEEWSRGSDDDN